MYQNLFITPNFKQKLNKLILEILQGIDIKQNELRLNRLRQSQMYPLALCQILVQSTSMPFMSLNTLQDNKKSFIALQIKKISQRTNNDQCWRLMREVYFAESDKRVASLIRETCLLYQAQDQNHNLIYLFLDVDLKHKGVKGLVRYLTFLHEMVRKQFKNLENETIKEYGEDVVGRLVQVLEWQLGDVVGQSVMAVLILLQGLIGDNNCWSDLSKWEKLIKKLKDSVKSPLIDCLAKHFIQEIRSVSYESSSPNQSQPAQLIQALKYCLNKTKTPLLSVETHFYFNCIQILSQYWVKSLRRIDQNQQLYDNQALVMGVIQNYTECFEEQEADEGQTINICEQEEDEMENETTSKRLSFLKTVLYIHPREKLIHIIETHTNYSIKIMQLSIHLPSLSRDGFLPNSMFQALLFDLECALSQQTDAHLFVVQKYSFIWTVLKYIAKFHHTFKPQLILRICYLVDFLIFKCDTLAREGFKILDFLVEKVLHIEGLSLLKFLGTTLTHINQNQWLESDICYFHAISIILNTSPQLIFEHPHQLLYKYQFSPLEKQILTMTRKMIALLQKSFNYDTMHQLNFLLQKILQPCALHLAQALRYDELFWVVTANFKYEILTDASGQIYFYFIQFSDNRLNMLESLDKYDFWKNCDSERLIFFVGVYTKLIDGKQNFFTSSEAEKKVITLRKNLWERYRSEMDEQEREKMVGMFVQNPKYFAELCVEAYQGQKWGQNRHEYWGRPKVGQEYQSENRMEID